MCATLAVYVYDSETYALENVISFLDKKLMSVSWSADGQKLATVSLDSCVYVADIHTSVTKLVYQSKFQVVNVTWYAAKAGFVFPSTPLPGIVGFGVRVRLSEVDALVCPPLAVAHTRTPCLVSAPPLAARESRT